MIWFTLGNEHNPSDPFGRVVITIDGDDVTLEHFSRAGNATYTGELGPGVADEITAALERGGFPHVPPHDIVAGASLRQLEVDGRSATVEDFFGRSLDGYKDAFAILDSLTLQLTGNAEHDRLHTPVSKIQKVG